ncbi:hypothetical protein J6590_057711 [Homalodisca vitripennis]|nr:hypothetical protein J6590_057711 [Homalodisca vitripennis]
MSFREQTVRSTLMFQITSHNDFCTAIQTIRYNTYVKRNKVFSYIYVHVFTDIRCWRAISGCRVYYLVLLNGNWVSESTFWHTITAAGVTLDRSIEVTVDDSGILRWGIDTVCSDCYCLQMMNIGPARAPKKTLDHPPSYLHCLKKLQRFNRLCILFVTVAVASDADEKRQVFRPFTSAVISCVVN